MSTNPRNAPASAAPQDPAAPPSRPRRPWLKWVVLTALALLVGYAAFVRPFTRPAAPTRGGFGNRAVPVTAVPARQADLNVRLIALGTVTPLSSVTVRSRVDGQLQKLFFEEGHTVEAGAPLAEIDPRPFEVQKLQAEAQASRDQALLENARLDLERFRTLFGQDSAPKQQVDTQSALVRQYEAAVKLDQAQIENATLQLTYAHIQAPTSGRVGLRLVDAGNMIRASDANGIAVITQLHPISVVFSLPQDALPKVVRRFKADEPMVVEAYDRDGRTLLATGKLVTVDNQIDLSTGTARIRAEFANTDDALFPNQFVNVQLLAEQIAGATVVPAAAVQRGAIGLFVYVISEEKTAAVRVVETGPTDRGLTAILKGVAPGEMVVVDGVDKLREGSAVELASREAGATGERPAGPGGRGGRSGKGKKSAPPSP